MTSSSHGRDLEKRAERLLRDLVAGVIDRACFCVWLVVLLFIGLDNTPLPVPGPEDLRG
jgi:uncharacterized RDD family membrane protein YckC